MIGDSGGRNVRLTGRIIGGRIELLDGAALPQMNDGVACDVVFSEDYLLDPAERERLFEPRLEDLLPAGEEVWLTLKPDQSIVDVAGAERKLPIGEAGVQFRIELLQPLILRGSQAGKYRLDACKCYIPALDTEAHSLNRAYLLLSEAFEKARRSHAGNVFKQGYCCIEGKWFQLDDLRRGMHRRPLLSSRK